MSQITFSHQFPQRWMIAPKPVKNAIVQELSDIVKLLDNDTDLATFEFTTPDLRLYIDTVYEDAAKDLEHKNLAELSHQRQVSLNNDETQVKDVKDVEKIESPVTLLDINNDKPNVILESMPTDIKSSNIDSSNRDEPNRVTIDENFMRELEMRIDDYLMEQLSDMSENLKAWLREEVKQYTKDK